MNSNVTSSAKGPLNQLFMAINHYISTGDKIGEGISLIKRQQQFSTGEPAAYDRVQILLAVNDTNPTDRVDFTKFVSRFKELQALFSTTLEALPQMPGFKCYSFTIKYGQCEELARELTKQPGALGWGSMKSLLEKHFPS